MTRTAFEIAADIIDPQGPKFDVDPVEWSKSKGLELWSRQREILESVRDHPITAVKSCHTVGKSYTATTAVSWWLDAHPPGSAFVVTSAPTGDQVKAILWREIGRMHKMLGLRGRTNLTEWYESSELVAFGRKPSDYSPTAFQGIHAEYLLVVLDEACGIPKALWEAADSLVSNRNGRILAIGNPDDPSSHFAVMCAYETVNTIQISAFDTPNFTGEPVSDRLSSLLISREWQERKAIEWTETSPVYIAKVLGEFPADAQDGVIPGSFLARCRRIELEPSGDVELGLDPARGGTDKAVCWARQGAVALRKWEWSYTPDPKDLAEKVLAIIQELDAKAVKIDADGLGWGISGILDVWHSEGKHDAISVPVYGGVAASNRSEKMKFYNARAEVWWDAREQLRTEAWDLRVLTDDDAADLTAPRYFTNPRGQIQIEKKEELKKRLGRSPDSGDALLLAFNAFSFPAVSYAQQISSINILGR